MLSIFLIIAQIKLLKYKLHTIKEYWYIFKSIFV